LEVEEVSHAIGIDPVKALKAIGSLGGGNHFIEAGYDSEENLWVTVHTGSRNFGKCVADFYQNKAKEGLKKYFIDEKLHKDLEFMLYDSKEAKDYLYALETAQDFADANRQEILTRIADFVDDEILDSFSSVHNFIEDGIIRKGATPAKIGQRVIIPFNMRDGIAICVGLGNPKYNFSAPHGAGRILSRTQAKKTLNTEEFVQQMKDANIYTTTANESTLDEAPGAYKDMKLILNNIKDTVKVIDFIKPIYNFKAGE
jgi:RNA-splicing ligase RtcB